MKILKSVAVVLASSLLLFSTACTNSNNTSTSGTSDIKADATKYNTGGTFPIAKQKTTLTIGVPQSPFVKDYKENSLTKELEEKGNVDLQFTLFPQGADYKTKVLLMITSETPLPDVLMGNPVEADQYVKDGLFLAMNGYYKSPDIAYYFNKKFENDPKMKDFILNNSKNYEGNTLGIITYAPELGVEYPYRMWINQTWLNNIGLNMPKTTDDFYNVLKAFTTQDPNKNGKKDEIGYIGSTDGWAQNVIIGLMNAFIYANPANDYLLLNNGKLEPAYTKPEWLEGIRYLNKLNSDGLLSPLSFTQKANQLQAILQNPSDQIVGGFAGGSVSVYQSKNERRKDMVIMPPLMGPKGICYSPNQLTIPYAQAYITKYCKNPELAFRLFDYASCDTTMAIWQRYGIPNKDWDTNVTGMKGLYEDALAIKAGFRQINNMWGVPQNSHWGGLNPAIRTLNDPKTMMASPSDPMDYLLTTAKAVPLYMNKTPQPVLRIVLTPDERNQIADISNSIKSYRDESTLKFIVSTKPLSEWNSYVEQLNKIGMNEYLKIMQTAYDRGQKQSK